MFSGDIHDLSGAAMFLRLVLVDSCGRKEGPAWGGEILSPPRFSRQLQYDGRYRRESFVTLPSINFVIFRKV